MSPSPPPSDQEASLAWQMAHKNETRQPQFIATVCICFFLAYLAVGLRLMARRRVRQPIMADDWSIIVALIPTTIWDGVNFWSIHAGLGLHGIRVTGPKALIQSAVGCMILYPMCLPPVKFSILLLYHRIFPGKWIKLVSIVIAAMVTGSMIAASIAFGLQCIPLSSMWNQTPGRCLNLAHLAIATGIINIVTDVAILCLPIKPLLSLKARPLVKAGLIGTFLLGGCVCVFSIVRTKIVGQSSFSDPSWNNAIGGMWSVIEVHVAIVSACLPVLKPLFVTPKSNSSTAASSRRYLFSTNASHAKGSKGTKGTKGRPKGPYSMTDGSLWQDEEDAMALRDTQVEADKAYQKSRVAHIDEV